MTSTVLLVGRHTGALASLVERLARSGHKVMLAWNPRDGVRMAREKHPDLVVLNQPAGPGDLNGIQKIVWLHGGHRPASAAALVERALRS